MQFSLDYRVIKRAIFIHYIKSLYHTTSGARSAMTILTRHFNTHHLLADKNIYMTNNCLTQYKSMWKFYIFTGRFYTHRSRVVNDVTMNDRFMNYTLIVD